MGRKAKTDLEKMGAIISGGVHFNIVQLARDLNPKPSAQRITQLVNNDGQILEYSSIAQAMPNRFQKAQRPFSPSKAVCIGI